MKRFFVIFFAFFMLLLSSCSHSKRLSKASNKIYRLTEKFPQLLQKTDTIIPIKAKIDGFSLNSQHVIKPFHILQDSLVLKDSLNVINIRNYQDSTIFDIQTTYPDREVNIDVPFSFQNILAQCNCKKEVRKATKELRRENRRLKLVIALIFLAVGAIVGFGVAKKVKTGGLL